MLGKFVRQLSEEPQVSVGSNQLLEAILAGWKEESSPNDVCLDKKEETWDEWWIYASSITKVCPRMYALGAIGGIPPETFKPETLWLFGQGNAYHDIFQQKIFPSLPREVVLGSWKRDRRLKRKSAKGHEKVIREEHLGLGKNTPVDGVEIVRGYVPRPPGKGWRYVEPKFRIPGHRTVVKPDGIFAWPGMPLEVVEFKSEKSQAKDSLNPSLGGRPRQKHIDQAHVEMWATGITRARIVYIFKGEYTLSLSVIEHVIERDEQIINRIKKETQQSVGAVAWAEEMISHVEDCADPEESAEDIMDRKFDMVDEEYPKPIPECQWKSKGKPKYCPARDLCFRKKKKVAKGKKK